jgi:hypothetical protein
VAAWKSSTKRSGSFISSTQDIGGTTYNVLYGGVQWGFRYSAEDLISPEPEPSSVLLLGTALVAAWYHRRRADTSRSASACPGGSPRRKPR